MRALTPRLPRSALLKAIAEKLIPGIPEGTRVAMLQQSRPADEGTGDGPGAGPSVLELVVDRATSRHAVERQVQSRHSPPPRPAPHPADGPRSAV